jgi:hypothetical protein
MLDAGSPTFLTRRNWILLAGSSFASWSAIYGFYGKEFWESKDPAEWSADDIAKLLTKSPWAKAVEAERTRTRKNRGPVGMGAPRTRIPGTAGSNSPSVKTITTYKGTVVWESAAPVRAALKTKLPDEFDGQYVIGVTGVPLAKSDTKGAMDRLRRVTTLQAKNRQPLEAAGAQVQHDNGTLYLFGFAKEGLPLSRDDKEVVFTTHMGNTLFTAKFNPKDMLYHGDLSL